MTATRNATTKISHAYIPTLDGWRAVAILAVLIGHATEAAGSPVGIGGQGVEIFFALSGFLITSRLLEELEQRGKLSLSQFYLRRAFRILPCCWAYLLVLSLVCLIGGLSLRLRDLAGAAFFFRNYTGAIVAGHYYDGDQWYTGHFWSLAVEEHFYLLWPALLIFAGAKHVAKVAAILALAIGSWRWVYSHTHWLDLPYVLPYFRSDLRLDFLFWGCFFAGILPKLRVWMQRFPEDLPALLILAVYAANWVHPMPLGAVSYPFVVACLIMSTVPRPHCFLGRLLELPIIRFIGHLSYSIYVWQTLFLVPTGVNRPMQRLQTATIGIPAALLVAYASYRYIEKPSISLGRRISQHRAEQRSLLSKTIHSDSKAD